MIDLNLLRNDSEKIKKLIKLKEPSFDVDRLIELDTQLRRDRSEVEALRKKKNDLAGKGAQGLTHEVRAQAIELGKQLKGKERELEKSESDFKKIYLSCPNIPQDDVPEGNKEANSVIRTIGEKPSFSFPIKHHLELNEHVQWFDMQVGAQMSGAQFVFYKTIGTKVLYALTRMMIKNNAKFGFEPVLPPYLVHEKSLYNSGNLPKFQGDFYEIKDEDLCLIPTAEVCLTNVYANQILASDSLPIRHTAWTPCFRREAGGYGSTERGLIRIHQFEKVEIYSVCKAEESAQELERLMECAESILKQLGLHYRVSLLAAQDCSFSSAKTYDVEVWLPGQDRYYEVSSSSNCTDFQARRAAVRHRKSSENKPELAHTLNGSSLALPRLMVALMENYQQADGSIQLPPLLVDAMNDAW